MATVHKLCVTDSDDFIGLRIEEYDFKDETPFISHKLGRLQDRDAKIMKTCMKELFDPEIFYQTYEFSSLQDAEMSIELCVDYADDVGADEDKYKHNYCELWVEKAKTINK